MKSDTSECFFFVFFGFLWIITKFLNLVEKRLASPDLESFLSR